MAAKDKAEAAAAAARSAGHNPYVQRILQDEELRDNMVVAVEAARNAYARLNKGKAPAKNAARRQEAAQASSSARPTPCATRRPRCARRRSPPSRRPSARAASVELLLVAIIGGAVALAASEGLRNKVLDALFGAEEEFDYSSNTSPARAAGGRARRLTRSPTVSMLDEGALRGAFVVVLAAWPVRFVRRGSGNRQPARAARRQGRADRRRDAHVGRRARHGGLDVRPGRARGGRLARACCTTTSARRSSCSSRSCGATATCASALLDAQLAGARTADDFVAGLVASLDDLVRNEPGFVTLIFELFTLSRRNEEIAAEFAELLRSQRERLAELLRAKEAGGRAARCAPQPEAVVDVIFSLGDGVAMRMLAEPERDFAATVAAGILVRARAARRMSAVVTAMPVSFTTRATLQPAIARASSPTVCVGRSKTSP